MVNNDVYSISGNWPQKNIYMISVSPLKISIYVKSYYVVIVTF